MPSPGLYLDWFNSPEDHFHSSSQMSIEAIWEADAELGTTVAQLPWAGDGVIEREQQLLEEIAGLAVQFPDLAGRILEYRWINDRDGVSREALKATGSIRAAAAIDPELARLLAGYRWLENGVNIIKANALAALVNLAGQDVDTAKSFAASSGFVNGTLEPERKAATAIYSIFESDPSVARTVTGYPWVSDGITYIEARTLDAIRELLAAPDSRNSGLAQKVASYPWVADGVTPGELDAIRISQELLETAESADSGLAGELAGYSWVADGVNQVERDTLYIFQELLKTAGAENSGSMEKLVGYAWVADGIAGPERDTLYIFQELLKTAGTENSGSMEKLVGYAWVADGMTEVERDALYYFNKLLETAGDANSGSVEKLLDYRWVADGITYGEADGLKIFSELLTTAGDANSGSVEKLVDYSWVADGITHYEAGELNFFSRLLGIANSGSVEKLVDYSWVADGITGPERDALRLFSRLLETAGNANSGSVEKLVGYSWVADGITDPEWDALRLFSTLLQTAGAGTSGVVETLVGYDWVADGITVLEPDTINRFSELMLAAGDANSGIVETLAGYAWMSDDINEVEKEALSALRDLLGATGASDAGIDKKLAHHWITGCVAFVRPEGQAPLNELLKTAEMDYPGFLENLVAAPWLADGVVFGEMETLRQVGVLLTPFDSVDSAVAGKLADYPWAPGGITAFECSALNRLRSLLNDADSGLFGKPWFEDGIDDEELAFLAVLHATKGRSIDQYQDLLDSHHTRSKTISLPLAGEVRLLVFRHSPFPAGDDSIELIEDIARALEEFMEVPFPRVTVAIGIIEPSLRAGEKPERGVGYALLDQLAITARKYNRDFHLTVFHEMAHIYWGGHTGAPAWFTEGAAGFLPDYAREATGVETISSRRVKLQQDWEDECRVWGAGTIRRFLSLRETDPDLYDSRGICNYALGEFFLLETYQLFGREAASAAMRELYLQAEATGWTEPVTEEQIYRVYLSSAPRGKVEAFLALYQRHHGGAYDDG